MAGLNARQVVRMDNDALPGVGHPKLNLATLLGCFTHERKTDDDGATVTMDFTIGCFHSVTLGGNRTFSFTAPKAPTLVLVEVIQDVTGSRTVTWPSTVKWAGAGSAPTLSTGAADIDHLLFFYDGTNYYEVSQKLNLS